MMKENTSLKVGRTGVEQNKYFLEELVSSVTRIASMYAKYRGSKTINSDDVNLAINDLLYGDS